MTLANIDESGVRRPGLVLPIQVDPCGLAGPTRMQVRGGAWRRTSRGMYVPSSVDGHLPEQRIIEAAAVLSGLRRSDRLGRPEMGGRGLVRRTSARMVSRDCPSLSRPGTATSAANRAS